MAKKKVKVEDAAAGKRERKSTTVKKRTTKKKVTKKKAAKKKVVKRKVVTQAEKDAAKKKRVAQARKKRKAETIAAEKKARKKFRRQAKKGFGTRSAATKKIAKKIGWAAARRVAGTALATATGPVGWAAVAALTAYELGKMANKKPKPTPTPKKVRVIERNKPTGGGSIGRTSMKDFKPKSKVETTKKKLKTSRYDPRKANRAGRKFGQRKAGGIIKKMKGGGRIKYI